VYTFEAAHNPEVAGTNPAPATEKRPWKGPVLHEREVCESGDRQRELVGGKVVAELAVGAACRMIASSSPTNGASCGRWRSSSWMTSSMNGNSVRSSKRMYRSRRPARCRSLWPACCRGRGRVRARARAVELLVFQQCLLRNSVAGSGVGACAPTPYAPRYRGGSVCQSSSSAANGCQSG
jgi:hypothetical protein